jgi:hypothetical protein
MMVMRRFGLALVLLAIPAAAGADSHKIELEVAPSYAHLSDLLGVHVSVAKTIREGEETTSSTMAASRTTCPEHYPWTVVADLTAHWKKLGSDQVQDEVERSFMAGPRFNMPHACRRTPMLFLQALFGLDYIRQGDAQSSDFAAAFGLGMDHLLDSKGYVALRLQADLVVSPWSKLKTSYPRAIVGIVFRLEEKHQQQR